MTVSTTFVANCLLERLPSGGKLALGKKGGGESVISNKREGFSKSLPKGSWKAPTSCFWEILRSCVGVNQMCVMDTADHHNHQSK